VTHTRAHAVWAEVRAATSGSLPAGEGRVLLQVTVDKDRIRFGEGLSVSFHRTLRVPDDGRTYPLPAGLGSFPIVAWHGDGASRHLIPLREREALWIGFSGAVWKPHAVKILCGGVNAVSGQPDEAEALSEPQDYLVCPLQPWLDGFNAGGGEVRQLVAMPLGRGYAVEAGQGLPERGGLAFAVFEPKPGRFPDAPPPAPAGPKRLAMPQAGEGPKMVLGAGGTVAQKIYRDPFGRETWQAVAAGRAEVTLVDAAWLAAATGSAAPAPITAAEYAAAGLPWFELADAAAGTVAPGGGAPARTVKDQDRRLGVPAEDDTIAPGQVNRITLRGRVVTNATDRGRGTHQEKNGCGGMNRR
jgi:hypothetical protein